MIDKKIELGDTVKDSVSGFTGKAVARTTWISGCDRIAVQPAVDKDGKLPDSMSFDEPLLVIVKKAVNKNTPAMHKTGGPQKEPQARTNFRK